MRIILCRKGKSFSYSNFLNSSNYIEAGPKESKVAEEYQMLTLWSVRGPRYDPKLKPKQTFFSKLSLLFRAFWELMAKKWVTKFGPLHELSSSFSRPQGLSFCKVTEKRVTVINFSLTIFFLGTWSLCLCFSNLLMSQLG